ncbi:MAG: hypothetical protein JRN22_02245 [Nitrososphaerota archaeon]|nr:hypothetical protein [Nitrososphaerota archaeon]
MPLTPRTDKVQKINYVASALQSRDIPKRILKGLGLTLAASTTNAAGGATITWESLCKLISKLVLTLNGQDVMINIPFWALYLLNYYDFSHAPNSVITQAAGAGSSQRMPLYLPFELTRSISPEDTTFDGRNLSSIVLDAYWNNSLGVNVTSIDSAELDIQTDEYLDATNKAVIGGARHEYAFISYAITGIGVIPFNIPTQGLNQYRRMFIMTRDNTGAASDAIASNLAVKSGAVYYENIAAQDIKDNNSRQYAMSPLTGTYVYDFTRNGKMTERLDARALSELIFEVTSLVAAGSIDVMFERAIYQ